MKHFPIIASNFRKGHRAVLLLATPLLPLAAAAALPSPAPSPADPAPPVQAALPAAASPAVAAPAPSPMQPTPGPSPVIAPRPAAEPTSKITEKPAEPASPATSDAAEAEISGLQNAAQAENEAATETALSAETTKVGEPDLIANESAEEALVPPAYFPAPDRWENYAPLLLVGAVVLGLFAWLLFRRRRKSAGPIDDMQDAAVLVDDPAPAEAVQDQELAVAAGPVPELELTSKAQLEPEPEPEAEPEPELGVDAEPASEAKPAPVSASVPEEREPEAEAEAEPVSAAAGTAPTPLSTLIRRVSPLGTPPINLGSDEQPAIELDVRPIRAGVTAEIARVEFELVIDNKGAAPARDVHIATWMFPGGTLLGAEMERSTIRQPASAMLPRVNPGDTCRIRSTVSLSTARLTEATVLPVVVAEARYRAEDGSRVRSAAKFMVGVPVDGAIAHFDVTNPAGLREDVIARNL